MTIGGFQEIWCWRDFLIYWSKDIANWTGIQFCFLQQAYECIKRSENRRNEGQEHSKNWTSLLEEDSKAVFGKSFRKHKVATAKAKKDSKEVYQKGWQKAFPKEPLITEAEWGYCTDA